jgi:hypothetical protein
MGEIKILNLCNPHKEQTANRQQQQQQRGFHFLASPLFAFMPPSYSHHRHQQSLCGNGEDLDSNMIVHYFLFFDKNNDLSLKLYLLLKS